jgi:transposase-like protein
MGKMRRAFTPEFKQEAVRQVTELGRPVSQVARKILGFDSPAARLATLLR